jgi:hypothetical protein
MKKIGNPINYNYMTGAAIEGAKNKESITFEI